MQRHRRVRVRELCESGNSAAFPKAAAGRASVIAKRALMTDLEREVEVIAGHLPVRSTPGISHVFRGFAHSSE